MAANLFNRYIWLVDNILGIGDEVTARPLVALDVDIEHLFYGVLVAMERPFGIIFACLVVL